jgi:hypothetical protein
MEVALGELLGYLLAPLFLHVIWPALVGLVTGLAFSLYLLGAGIVNTLGSLGLFIYDSAKILAERTKRLWSMGDKFLKDHFSSRGAYAAMVALLAVPAVIATILLIVATLIQTDLIATWNVLRSIILTTLIASACPFIGLFSGIKSIFSKSSPFDITKSYLSRWGARPVQASVGQQSPLRTTARMVSQLLPVNRRLLASEANTALIENINTLSPSFTHRTLQLNKDTIDKIEKLPASDPNKKLLDQYNKINEEYVCALNLDNLYDLNRIISVEYKDNANKWHTKVFDDNAFQQMISSASGYAFLPESRTPITQADRVWQKEKTNDKDALICDDRSIKIYRGITPELEKKIADIVKPLRQAVNNVAANSNSLFNIVSAPAASVSPGTPMPQG